MTVLLTDWIPGRFVVTGKVVDKKGVEVVFDESHVVGVGAFGDNLVDSVASEGVCGVGVDVSDTCVVARHEKLKLGRKLD